MPTPQTYSPATESALGLWVKLSRAHATLDRIAKQDIARYGLTEPQFAVLECLGHCGSLKQRDLSRKMLVTGGNTSLVIDNLEKVGLVRRKRNLDDRRTVSVHLTPKGMKRFQESFPQHAAAIAAAAGVLTPGEQKNLSRLLRKLGRSLAEGDSTHPSSPAIRDR